MAIPKKKIVTSAEKKAALKMQAPNKSAELKAAILDQSEVCFYKAQELTKTPFLILGAVVVDTEYGEAVEFTIQPQGKPEGTILLALNGSRQRFVDYFEQGGKGKELGEFIARQGKAKNDKFNPPWLFNSVSKRGQETDSVNF